MLPFQSHPSINLSSLEHNRKGSEMDQSHLEKIKKEWLTMTRSIHVKPLPNRYALAEHGLGSEESLCARRLNYQTRWQRHASVLLDAAPWVNVGQFLRTILGSGEW